jgi:hypothetical protein
MIDVDSCRGTAQSRGEPTIQEGSKDNPVVGREVRPWGGGQLLRWVMSKWEVCLVDWLEGCKVCPWSSGVSAGIMARGQFANAAGD